MISQLYTEKLMSKLYTLKLRKHNVSQIIYHPQNPVWKILKINSFQKSLYPQKQKKEKISFQISLLLRK